MAASLGFPASQAAPSPLEFPVVGIGCPVQGFKAVEEFLSGIPDKSGMAVVVVQHMLPDQTGILAELRRHVARTNVLQAGDGMAVQADTVYVVPPDKDAFLRDGVLHLVDPAQPNGLRRPLDLFLCSLAEDQRENAVGIVLSGLGGDGAAGLSAIQEQAGLTLVQSPDGALSEGAAQVENAVQGADIAARPKEMPALIVAYLKHPMRTGRGDVPAERPAQGDLDRIVALLRDFGGNDFSLYKNVVLIRRIDRRIALNQLAGLAEYQDYLRNNPHELGLLSRELLIGVTSFFRDPQAWVELERNVVPALLARLSGAKSLRAWVPACSTGEEAYSLAILLYEALERTQSVGRIAVQIYASDLDSEAVIRARQGRYPGVIAASMSPERLGKFFTMDGGCFCLKKKIREIVVFSKHNIISDPPFSKIDIICCRNLLIYFKPDLQTKIIKLFSYCLNAGGILFLGDSEDVGTSINLFAPAGAKAHLFRRLDPPAPSPAFRLSDEIATCAGEGGAAPPQSLPQEKLGVLTDALILQTFAPPRRS